MVYNVYYVHFTYCTKKVIFLLLRHCTYSLIESIELWKIIKKRFDFSEKFTNSLGWSNHERIGMFYLFINYIGRGSITIRPIQKHCWAKLRLHFIVAPFVWILWCRSLTSIVFNTLPYLLVDTKPISKTIKIHCTYIYNLF